MKIFGYDFSVKKEKKAEAPVEKYTSEHTYKEAFLELTRAGFGQSFVLPFNGEKNLGGIGPVESYFIDYDGFRCRSWKAYLDNGDAQTILRKHLLWAIGSGLKLNSEPAVKILKQYKININAQEFNDVVEARFALFANSVESDYSGMQNLHQQSGTCFLDSKIGGDMLCILRTINDNLTLQLVDGEHLQNPFEGSSYIQNANTEGNIIKNGIEINKYGAHVAYYVRSQGLNKGGTDDMTLDFETERIPAKSKSSGLDQAFLVRGLNYRKDNVRGIPLLAAVMETLAYMERYKEATLGSAEETAKIIYTVEHGPLSTGEDPMMSMAKIARGQQGDKMPIDADGNAVANKISVSTNKMAVNMPRDSHLKAFSGGKEIYFKDFYSVNAEAVCATVGIPYPVAMSKYDSSYSSSRAAIKDWEHTLNVVRKDFTYQFYSKIYAYWLDLEILKGNIDAPGYLEARLKGNTSVLAAYRCARFVGAAVPHIDPLKEVEASRAKLGATGVDAPLSTVERETEALNSGESYGNIEQYALELKKIRDAGIKLETPVPPPIIKEKKP
jgi:capsid protein